MKSTEDNVCILAEVGRSVVKVEISLLSPAIRVVVEREGLAYRHITESASYHPLLRRVLGYFFISFGWFCLPN